MKFIIVGGVQQCLERGLADRIGIGVGEIWDERDTYPALLGHYY